MRRFGFIRRGFNREHISRIKLGALYFILLAGGFWHLLGILQDTMRILAGPVIIVLGIWLAGEYYRILSTHSRLVFIAWSFFVLGASFFVELIGAQTGVIFGKYQYGQVLRPVIRGVPLAIGFAWLGMLLASNGVVDWLVKNTQQKWLLRGLLIAVSMVLFDFLLEQVAVTLGYWHWFGGGIPLRNYTAWFVISLFFTVLGLRFNAVPNQAPMLAKHIFFAQILYFGLVLLK